MLSHIGRRPRGGCLMSRLGIEELEPRNQPAVTATLAGGVLNVLGDADRNSVSLILDPASNQLVVRNFLTEVARFDSPAVTSVNVNLGAGQDVLPVDRAVTQPVAGFGDADDDILKGGPGVTMLNGGAGNDKLVAGPGVTALDGGPGNDILLRVKTVDTAIVAPEDRVALFPPPIV